VAGTIEGDEVPEAEADDVAEALSADQAAADDAEA
jgi:hypothetical protein